MYKISQLTGYIYFNNVRIEQDDRLQEYNDLIDFMRNGGELIEIESTPEEIHEINVKKAVEIDLIYKSKITNLLSIHIEKKVLADFLNETYVIPQKVLDDREALKAECNALIEALGITDYTYRQSIPELMKPQIEM